MLSEPNTGRCVSEDAGPRKGVDCENAHKLERGTSANENAGPWRGPGGVSTRMLGHEGGWIVRSHIDWREERVLARTLSPTLVGEENEAFLIRVWKSLPSKHVLKTLRGSVKWKSPKRTISVSGGLGRLHKCTMFYDFHGFKNRNCFHNHKFACFFIQGLTPTGYLLAIGDDNQMCELHPDGNRWSIWMNS